MVEGTGALPGCSKNSKGRRGSCGSHQSTPYQENAFVARKFLAIDGDIAISSFDAKTDDHFFEFQNAKTD